MATFLVVQPNLDIYGGAEKVCHHVIKTLVLHGQRVELLTFEFNAERYAEIMGEALPETVVVHSLGERMEVSPPFTIYKKRNHIVRLFKKFRNQLQYDFLFSTQSSSPFETVYLNKAQKNIAYIHFPEIHFDYAHASLKRKIYLWLFKRWVEKGIEQLDLVFCNSNYTKGMVEEYWASHGIKDATVVYPPVNLDAFWCDTPLEQRRRRVVYVGRFIPQKRHDIIKRLASELPQYEFVSIGGLMDSEKEWFNSFSQNLPANYLVKPNLSGTELVETLQDSRVYVHLMAGEHFGIAPIEALASGCITFVHNSGGSGEFVPDGFRWETYEDLKSKIVRFMDSQDEGAHWEAKRKELWSKIAVLKPEEFQERIWAQVEPLVR